jgi:hypothetical protein
MEFEFKITTWERVNVSPKDEEKVLQAIKDGKITSSQDIFDLLETSDIELTCNTIDETEEQMSPEENDGQNTIEVRNDDGDVIWGNGVETN